MLFRSVKNNLFGASVNANDSLKFISFINEIDYWRSLARTNMTNGLFPIYSEENAGGMTHGGLIFRPVDKRENYIKRCIGIPGDKIEIINSKVIRNGKAAKIFDHMAFKWDVSKSDATLNASNLLSNYNLENAPDGSRTDFDFTDSLKYVLNLTLSEKAAIQKDYPKIKFKVHIDRESYSKANRKPNPEELIDNLECFPKDFYVNNTMTDFHEFTVPKDRKSTRLNSSHLVIRMPSSA